MAFFKSEGTTSSFRSSLSMDNCRIFASNVIELPLSLRDALNSLSLELKETEATKITEKVLVEKVLSTRVFRLFTIADIIKKSWRLKGRVQVGGCPKRLEILHRPTGGEFEVFNHIVEAVEEDQSITNNIPALAEIEIQGSIGNLSSRMEADLEEEDFQLVEEVDL
ncbi:hypothetical protein FNV43_RR09738 [Rhamnella rubrinervis]|uniref:Uncharacterized protein n=1 Tax=Rhamnella rubrinervis TaxID=2594499 RepID=A0A8K0MK24_9ROSA|nr:hypothetical protein FNV43_RR09738 [Rhamnella rubrinervis]